METIKKVSKFNLDKSIEVRNNLQDKIISYWRDGLKNHQSLDKILVNLKHLYNSDNYKRLQTWAKNELRGVDGAMLKIAYESLEWACLYDGEYFGLVKNIVYDKNFKQELLEPSHYYIGTQIKFN